MYGQIPDSRLRHLVFKKIWIWRSFLHHLVLRRFRTSMFLMFTHPKLTQNCKILQFISMIKRGAAVVACQDQRQRPLKIEYTLPRRRNSVFSDNEEERFGKYYKLTTARRLYCCTHVVRRKISNIEGINFADVGQILSRNGISIECL